MKQVTLTILLLFFAEWYQAKLFAQCSNTCGSNAISNPGFETATNFCSVNDIQLYSNQTPVQGWFGTEYYSAGAGSTPDYFSPCAGTSNSANSSCISGSARIGLFTKTSATNTREYVQTHLSAPLVAGKTYCYSMVVVSKKGAAGNLLSSCDGIGAWFHNQGLINILAVNGGTQFLGAGTTVNASPQIQNPSGNLIGGTCQTISGTFCAQGGEQYLVIGNFRNDASTQITGSSPFNYMYIDDVSLFEVCAVPLTNSLNAVASVCPGSCTTISSTAAGASGTYAYLWQPGNYTTASINVCPNVTTTYTLTTSSTSPCGLPISITDTITINVNNCFGVIANGANICLGTCATLTADTIGNVPGPLSYTWQPGNLAGNNVQVCPNATTIYTLVATDANGVQYTDTALVNIIQLPLVNAGLDDTICVGTSTTLHATGVGTFSWNTVPTQSTQDVIVSPTNTSTYVLSLTSGTCVGYDTVKVIVAQTPIISIQKNDVSCYGVSDGSAAATVSGGFLPIVYSWNPGGINSFSITGIPQGTYTFSVTDAVGCTNSQSVIINQPAPMALSISGPSLVCMGSAATLSAVLTGGNVPNYYDWHGAGGNVSSVNVAVNSNSTYVLTVIDTNGCIGTDSLTITASPIPTAYFSDVDKGCVPFDKSFTNASANAQSYTWIFGDGSTSNALNPTHTFEQAGVYTVSLIATSVAGCADTVIVNNCITVMHSPTNIITVNKNTIGDSDPNATFSFSSDYSSDCIVDLGDGTIVHDCENNSLTHTYSDTGIFCATIISTNELGCSFESKVCINVYPDFAFYIPNSFTPNRDGLNDSFTGYGINFKDFSMLIYNRWGVLIYETNEYDKPWMGNLKGSGELAEVDTYVYKIEISNYKNTRKSYSGIVSLIK